MTIYDDNKHPRGQADNPGQFRDKSNSGPEAVLAHGGPSAPVGGLRTDQVVLHYVCDAHDSPIRAEQPLTDIVDAGTLICPECGEDMALEASVGVRSIPDDPEAIAAREAQTTANQLTESLRDILAEDAQEHSAPARTPEEIADDAMDELSNELSSPDDLQRIRGAIEDAAREAQSGLPASDPAIELVEWARTAQEFMQSDKSNDWGEEIASLDAILESED